ncbi:helix-turn-helix domain-containing protein [Microbacterium sp. NPDC089698]|uniref:helix-turn-helix domain-containing protein n=1 Tax=Microbacterium sp. NPDC089698 TaxID=3364200 RepID=UPI0037FF08C2
MNAYAPTAVSKEIASRLRGQIARYDVSQAELAMVCGVSQSQFSKIIRATRPMTVDMLAAICDALGIDMGDLIASVEALISNQALHASPVSYVDEEVRLDVPFVWGPDTLDTWGREALARINNVPGPSDTQDDYDLVAKKRSKDRGEDLE